MPIGSGSLANLARAARLQEPAALVLGPHAAATAIRADPPGETRVLGEIAGAGCVKHIWMTMASLPDGAARAAPDGAAHVLGRRAHPSVEVPLGDFFGIGFGLRRNFVSLPLQMSPQDGRGFNCWFPMPFAERRALRGREPGPHSAHLLLLRRLRGARARSIPTSARFHAWWNRTNRPPARRASTATPARLRLQRRATGRRRPRLAGPWPQPNLTGERNYVILDVARPRPLRRLQPEHRRLRAPGERLVRRGRRHDLHRRRALAAAPARHRHRGLLQHRLLPEAGVLRAVPRHHRLQRHATRGRGAARTRCTASTSRTRSASSARSASRSRPATTTRSPTTTRAPRTGTSSAAPTPLPPLPPVAARAAARPIRRSCAAVAPASNSGR